MPNPLSANPAKWSKHTQTIRRQEPTNCLSVFDYFVGLTLNGVNILDSKKLLGTNQILPKFMLQLIFCVSLTAWKVSVVGIFLVLIFPHSN